MLAVIIPTYASEASLGASLVANRLSSQTMGELAGAAGFSYCVVVSDGGSTDATLEVAVKHGAQLAVGAKGRGQQLALGTQLALANPDVTACLYLHDDTQLPKNWPYFCQTHLTLYPNTAAYFKFGADAKGVRARWLEFVVGMRCFWLKQPYGDQGLLIERDMLTELGGYPSQTLFEDVEITRRIKSRYGRKALRVMRGRIKTDVAAFYREGMWKRGVRNLKLTRAYYKGECVEELAELYGGKCP